MSLQLGSALKGGAERLASRTGVVVLTVYAAVMLVYQLSVNTLLQSLLTSLVPAGADRVASPALVTLPLPNVVAGVLVVVTLLAATVVSVVAVRTFVARERERIPRRFLTDRMLFVVANLVVGGIAFGLIVLVGTILLVVPGIVAYVGLLFMVQFVAVEKVNFVTAMRRSWRLTRGSRIRIFLLVLVLFAATLVVTFVVNFGLGLAVGSGSAGLGVGLVNVLLTLYLLAVTCDAFVQLRDDDRSPTGTQPTADAVGT
ncbi:hypothetical protein [Salinigranum salinum]|uniref:hypothetical protein n=1 Tax=Salinigranum salinum TaxID=1364937 RepID=UPI001260B9C9|nr:hypothetical protein [Salinigranum salinum]